MTQNPRTDNFEEKRTESRTIIDEYYSVEFEIPGSQVQTTYQFKIRDISDHGMCLLIKKDSMVMQHLKKGDDMEMKYWPEASSAPPRVVRTQIKHITQDKRGRFKGHYLVGLRITPA